MNNQGLSSKRIDWFEAVYEASGSLHSLIADLHVGVLVHGAGGETLYCNRVAADLLGLTEEEVLEKTCFDSGWDVIREDGTPFNGPDRPVPQAIKTRQASRNVVMGVQSPARPDRVWLNVNADPMVDGDGGVAHVVCTFSDITASRVVEERMRQSHEYFRVMADTAPVLIWVSATDMLSTFFNKPWLEFTGRTMEQEIGYGWAEGVHPDDVDRCLEIYRSSFDARKDFTMDYRLRRFDGEYRWILDQGVPWWMPDGSFAGYIGCGTDITEMKRAQELTLATSRRAALRADLGGFLAWRDVPLQPTLQAAAESLVLHLDVGLACIWIRTKDGAPLELLARAGVVLENDGLADLCLDSIGMDSIVSGKWPYVTDLNGDLKSSELSKLARNGVAGLAVYPLIVEARVTGALAVFTRRPPTAEILEDLVSVTDILGQGIERKRAQESLARSEEFKNKILESSNDCIKVLDLEGKLMYMNSGGARQLEIDHLPGLLGTDWTTFFTGADKLAARSAIARARAGEVATMQGECPTSSGTRKWWDNVITPINNAAGEVECLLTISRDITESKRAEEDLRAALDEVRRLKDQLHQENIYLQEEIKLEHNFEEIVGQTEAIKRVLYKIEQVASLDTTVLILGETGSGKELVARAIHSLSARKNRPLVKVNCAALPGSLIESELFGHEKGAFTDAHSRKIGRFELANGGTLFLDEIGELPMDLQAKLLRALQDGEFERVGSSSTIKVETRILGASNRDLKAEMQAGRFREDLWYRLSVFPITVPPLRDRKEDIPLLVKRFVSKLAKKLGKSVKTPSGEMMSALQNHAWPGNVRELANVIERAIIDARGETLDFTDVLEIARGPGAPRVSRSLEDVEREIIVETLGQTRGKIEGNDGAARSLGLNPSTLRTRMKKLGIQRRPNAGFPHIRT